MRRREKRGRLKRESRGMRQESGMQRRMGAEGQGRKTLHPSLAIR